MAVVTITLCVITARINEHPPFPTDEPIQAAEVFTSSAVSQPTTMTAPTLPGADTFWCVQSNGGAVKVAAGTAPVAAAGSPWVAFNGRPLFLRATPGYKLAIIDAL